MASGALVRPARALSGRIRVPGDKSIGHRALLFGAIASGATRVRGLPDGEDVAFEGEGPDRIVRGLDFDGLSPPAAPLDFFDRGYEAHRRWREATRG